MRYDKKQNCTLILFNQLHFEDLSTIDLVKRISISGSVNEKIRSSTNASENEYYLPRLFSISNSLKNTRIPPTKRCISLSYAGAYLPVITFSSFIHQMFRTYPFQAFALLTALSIQSTATICWMSGCFSNFDPDGDRWISPSSLHVRLPKELVNTLLQSDLTPKEATYAILDTFFSKDARQVYDSRCRKPIVVFFPCADYIQFSFENEDKLEDEITLEYIKQWKTDPTACLYLQHLSKSYGSTGEIICRSHEVSVPISTYPTNKEEEESSSEEVESFHPLSKSPKHAPKREQKRSTLSIPCSSRLKHSEFKTIIGHHSRIEEHLQYGIGVVCQDVYKEHQIEKEHHMWMKRQKTTGRSENVFQTIKIDRVVNDYSPIEKDVEIESKIDNESFFDCISTSTRPQDTHIAIEPDTSSSVYKKLSSHLKHSLPLSFPSLFPLSLAAHTNLTNIKSYIACVYMCIMCGKNLFLCSEVHDEVICNEKKHKGLFSVLKTFLKRGHPFNSAFINECKYMIRNKIHILDYVNFESQLSRCFDLSIEEEAEEARFKRVSNILQSFHQFFFVSRLPFFLFDSRLSLHGTLSTLHMIFSLVCVSYYAPNRIFLNEIFINDISSSLKLLYAGLFASKDYCIQILPFSSRYYRKFIMSSLDDSEILKKIKKAKEPSEIEKFYGNLLENVWGTNDDHDIAVNNSHQNGSNSVSFMVTSTIRINDSIRSNFRKDLETKGYIGPKVSLTRPFECDSARFYLTMLLLSSSALQPLTNSHSTVISEAAKVHLRGSIYPSLLWDHSFFFQFPQGIQGSSRMVFTNHIPSLPLVRDISLVESGFSKWNIHLMINTIHIIINWCSNATRRDLHSHFVTISNIFASISSMIPPFSSFSSFSIIGFISSYIHVLFACLNRYICEYLHIGICKLKEKEMLSLAHILQKAFNSMWNLIREVNYLFMNGDIEGNEDLCDQMKQYLSSLSHPQAIKFYKTLLSCPLLISNSICQLFSHISPGEKRMRNAMELIYHGIINSYTLFRDKIEISLISRGSQSPSDDFKSTDSSSLFELCDVQASSKVDQNDSNPIKKITLDDLLSQKDSLVEDWKLSDISSCVVSSFFSSQIFLFSVLSEKISEILGLYDDPISKKSPHSILNEALVKLRMWGICIETVTSLAMALSSPLLSLLSPIAKYILRNDAGDMIGYGSIPKSWKTVIKDHRHRLFERFEFTNMMPFLCCFGNSPTLCCISSICNTINILSKCGFIGEYLDNFTSFVINSFKDISSLFPVLLCENGELMYGNSINRSYVQNSFQKLCDLVFPQAEADSTAQSPSKLTQILCKYGTETPSPTKPISQGVLESLCVFSNAKIQIDSIEQRMSKMRISAMTKVKEEWLPSLLSQPSIPSLYSSESSRYGSSSSSDGSILTDVVKEFMEEIVPFSSSSMVSSFLKSRLPDFELSQLLTQKYSSDMLQRSEMSDLGPTGLDFSIDDTRMLMSEYSLSDTEAHEYLLLKRLFKGSLRCLTMVWAWKKNTIVTLVSVYGSFLIAFSKMNGIPIDSSTWKLIEEGSTYVFLSLTISNCSNHVAIALPQESIDFLKLIEDEKRLRQ
ncbi:hypothetical protein ADUPG1_009848 [Aduncisulcus paluster]|uniref:Uncharacterized protein n=1 Tax=Aduncisulcus paluster TaxID=2918883 RepID=A0ABQ5KWZ4_9EUKA|nr:hypothetical protein ADUPG1_009848 [Aduncisulcus paluster]